jgi:transcriptional regulator of acetoin/glycerol metabolism
VASALPAYLPGGRATRLSPMLVPLAGGSSTVVNLGELMMILELHRQGLKVSAIARQLGVDRKTVRKYIARGLERLPPVGTVLSGKSIAL